MTGHNAAAPAGQRALPEIFFLDIEASALSFSGFPVEIAWVDASGVGESHLIRPADDWLELDGDYEWSLPSENVHGISLRTLLDEGASHERVARRVAEVLARPDVVVFSDFPPFDGGWLLNLFETAGVAERIRIVNVDALYRDAVLPLIGTVPADGLSRDRAIQRMTNLGREILDAAADRAMLRKREHRALPDAIRLWLQWSDIRAEVAGWLAGEAHS